MAGWKSEISKVTHPLQGTEGKPLISEAGPDDRYVGRVIVEVWDSPHSRHPTGADHLAYVVDPAHDATNQGGAMQQLLQRVATALPARLANDLQRQRDRPQSE